MRFRDIQVLTRDTARSLRQREEPHGLCYQFHVLRHVIRALHAQDGNKLRFGHVVKAAVAVLLWDLGAVGCA